MGKALLRCWTTCWLRPAVRRRPNASPFRPMVRRQLFVRLGNPSSRQRRRTLDQRGHRARTVLSTARSLKLSSLNNLPQNLEVESEPDYDYGDVPFIVGFPSGHHHHDHHPDDNPGSPSPPLRGPFTPNPAGVPGRPTHLPFSPSHLPFGSSRAR